MKKTILLLILSALTCLYGCGESDRAVDIERFESSQIEEAVRSNCNKVLEAVEAFAEDNNGDYPRDTYSDETLSGMTLIDLLPDGVRLVNPYTMEQTEPVDSTASNPGETGYRSYYPFWPRAYSITGYGVDSLIVEICNIGALEDSVTSNCLAVAAAADSFAAHNNGIYPENVNVDADLDGHTLVDLLPGGHYLRNPLTGVRTEPIDAPCCNPGETGYRRTYCAESGKTGYCITGCGRDCQMCFLLEKSCE